MALTPVPQSNQTLPQTQNPILVNFQTIDADFSINHVPYNSGGPTEGMHAAVQYANQAATPTNVIPDGGLASMIYAAAGTLTGAASALYYKPANQNDTMKGFEFTAASLTSPGFAMTPAGLMIQWGPAHILGSDGLTGTQVSFNKTFPNACFVVVPASTSVASIVAEFITVRSDTIMPNKFNAYIRNQTNTTFITGDLFYIAIGW